MAVLAATVFICVYMYQTVGLGPQTPRALYRLPVINQSSFMINHSSVTFDHTSPVNHQGLLNTSIASSSNHSSCPRHYLFKDGKPCPTPTSPKDFVGVDSPFSFYSYSAFLITDSSIPQIAIIFIRTATKQYYKPRCEIQFTGSDKYVRGNRGWEFYTMQPLDKNELGEIWSGIFYCMYPKGYHYDKVAKHVRIYTGSSLLSSLPVEELAKPPKRKSLALCLARTYQIPYCSECTGINYTYHLPEWIEMQRILGVDKIFVYNVSIGADASYIFNYYARQGFVEVLSHAPIHNETYMPVSMGITECIYRNRYAYDYVLAIDMDEFIIPIKWNTYQDIIRDLLMNQTLYDQIRFPGGHFLTSPHLENNNSEPYLQTMTYRRYNYTAFAFGGKSIVNPRNCKIATAHKCTNNNRILNVDPRDALMHHYKGCSTRFLKAKQDCDKKSKYPLKFTTNSTEKFHTRLRQAVHKAFHELKLWGF